MPERFYQFSDEEASVISQLEKLGMKKVAQLVEVIKKYNISVDSLIDYLEQVKRVPNSFEVHLNQLTDEVEEIKRHLNIDRNLKLLLEPDSQQFSRKKYGFWSKDEVFNFLDTRTKAQTVFFSILSNQKEIQFDDLIQQMGKKLREPDFNGRNLAGSLGGIGLITKNRKKEPLYEGAWKEKNGEEYYYYWLNPKYRSIITDWFK